MTDGSPLGTVHAGGCAVESSSVQRPARLRICGGAEPACLPRDEPLEKALPAW